MRDEVAYHLFDGRGFDVELRQVRHRVVLRGAHVRLLTGEELCVNEDAVLKVINAERGGLAEADRAEVGRDLDAALVRLVNRRAQLCAVDVHVGFERGDALVGPLSDHAARVVGACEDVELRGEGASAVEVRAGDVDARAGDAAVVDHLLDVEVGVGLDAPGRAHRGDARAEVEAREAPAHLVEEREPPRRVEEVLVHQHEAGDDAAARQVQHTCALGNLRRS